MTEQDREFWQAIAAPLDKKQIKYRKAGSGSVAYVSREDVIYRLNQVCPGEWEFRTELIATPQTGGTWVVKGILTIRGVTREEYGIPANDDHFDPPKAAVSDALKRCASQFGFALELYGEEPPAPGETGSATTTTATGTGNAEKGTQGGSGGAVDKHWTVDQDWKKFYVYTSKELGLNNAQVHEACKVASMKEFKGSKQEALDMLKAYADKKRGPSFVWDDITIKLFWDKAQEAGFGIQATLDLFSATDAENLYATITANDAFATLDAQSDAPQASGF